MTFDLDDRYADGATSAVLTGVQSLVRLLLVQRRLDAARGLRTGAFISGYPGSPLGGLDRELQRARAHLEPAGVVFDAGVNEELAATAVAGTQLVPELPGHRVDGVAGFWFGKAPGLDRAADAIRHGNTSGTSHLGGAVAIVGDDPTCKSSTLPSSCELMAESLAMPLLAPGQASDIVRLGLHAVALSRAAGLWTAMKIVSDVADATVAGTLSDHTDEIPLPPRDSRGNVPTLLGASAVAAEHDLFGTRLERAREYGRVHRLNRIVHEPPTPRTALVAPGPAFSTLSRALRLLDIDDDALDALGVRLVRMDLVWPIHPDDVAELAAGVEQVIVVEDKRPFVERQIRDALYGRAGAPEVLGKRDAYGRPLVPLEGAVDADLLARRLGALWSTRLPAPASARVERIRARVRAVPPPLPRARTPFFCPGCPHNLSTRAPEEQLVGAGIGCHSLIALDPAGARGHLIGAPQMGGEGAQWIGMAPFTDDRHYRQNLGDGTFHHSGSLAIRAAVASGITITYRLLYNDAIAMTGGQPAPGRLAIDDLVRWLELEGVRRVIVTSEDPAAFAGMSLPAFAQVRHRDDLEAAQQELALVDGVTVLIHADRCATEERRLRKRGKLPTPAQRVWINERVCEGCGDCGQKSSCLSLTPTATEYGRKTQVHQSTCTQDLACLDGDCPSFLVVTPAATPRAAPAPPAPPVALPDPPRSGEPAQSVLIRMPGIGGTGVVTVSQILQVAALLDGKQASGLDQTGLAQKGGAVVSDVRISPVASDGAVRAAGGEVDLLLGLDLLGAVTADTLRTLDPERTVAVVNLHRTPTAAEVTDPQAAGVEVSDVVARIEATTRADRALWLDAGTMAEQLFADHMPANMLMLGAAYQHGCLPMRGEAIEQAIELNGTGVATNLAAFRWGRAAVVDRLAVERAIAERAPAAPKAPALPPALAPALATHGLDGPLADLVSRRAADLAAYGGTGLAARFIDRVAGVAAAERAALGDDAGAIALAYARSLHRLTAYKDEYEVARLHLDAVERARVEQAFGSGARVQVMLHPPVLRSLGMRRKIGMGRTAVPLFRALHAARRLRGTPLDPFGRARVRRVERALVEEYCDAMATAMAHLGPDTAETVAAIAALPEQVRGYEQIKLDSVERYRAAMAEHLERLAQGAVRQIAVTGT